MLITCCMLIPLLLSCPIWGLNYYLLFSEHLCVHQICLLLFIYFVQKTSEVIVPISIKWLAYLQILLH